MSNPNERQMIADKVRAVFNRKEVIDALTDVVCNAISEAIGQDGMRSVLNMPTFTTPPNYDTENHVFYIERGEGLRPHVHVEKGNKIAKFWLDTPDMKKAIKDRGNMNDSELFDAWKHVNANREDFTKQYRTYYPRPDKPQQMPKQQQSKTQKKKEQALPKTKSDAKVNVTDITANGCTLRVRSKDYYLSFVSGHPYFLGVPAEEIKQVALLHDSLRWKALDIYIGIDQLEHPRRYPCLIITKTEYERIQDVLKYPERYPDIKFTKRQRESLQCKIDRIAEHWQKNNFNQ